MESNAPREEHEFARPDEPRTTKPALSNLTNSFRYVPEDSCDSILSVDDNDEDEDDEDATDTPGKSLNKLFQGPSPGKFLDNTSSQEWSLCALFWQ